MEEATVFKQISSLDMIPVASIKKGDLIDCIDVGEFSAGN